MNILQNGVLSSNRRIRFPFGPIYSSSLESGIPPFHFQISFSPLGAISWKFNRVSVKLLESWKEKNSWLLSFCRAAALVVWSAKEFLLAFEVLTLKFPDILMIVNHWFFFPPLQVQVIILNPKPRNISMYAKELVRRYGENAFCLIETF